MPSTVLSIALSSCSVELGEDGQWIDDAAAPLPINMSLARVNEAAKPFVRITTHNVRFAEDTQAFNDTYNSNSEWIGLARPPTT